MEEGRLLTVGGDPGGTRLEAWDRLVRSCPTADVAQLSAWARVRSQAGYRARYVLVEESGEVVGGAQVLVRRLPLVGEIGYVPYGPLVAPGVAGRAEVADAVARGLRDLAVRHTRMLFVQPPEDGEDVAGALRHAGFRPSAAEVAPRASVHVDLTADEERLRRGLSRRLQQWTRVWGKRGVTVRQGDSTDLPLLADLLAQTAEHQGFTPFGLDYLQVMHRELAADGHLAAFVGEVDGRPVAMCLLTGCGSVLRSRLMGLDRSDQASRLNVSAAVFWTAMLWGRSAGYRWFDFGGLLPESVPAVLGPQPPRPDDLAGMDRYKLRFGGSPYLCPEPLELIPSPLVRRAYDLARGSSAGSRLLATAQRAARAGAVLRPGLARRRRQP
ncbi:lipid II:glycine glycyltransferase FemX [Blastococcus sp. PRF04-17]|uniref:lipid II:glycine glycyltransferase FemX n=1 Tax=Blastococcus sp. PRF04-17 TaxID=2933797 RepID=UPI001FF551E4|nr:GNAT family N-acetyltransferase [Blastococcus sp. PRF04-17]UOY00199.1 peptidoglycan bridge formation glycyltransferase FemA/FemB family protein [Blastococcus sp. PRF04-17]